MITVQAASGTWVSAKAEKETVKASVALPAGPAGISAIPNSRSGAFSCRNGKTQLPSKTMSAEPLGERVARPLGAGVGWGRGEAVPVEAVVELERRLAASGAVEHDRRAVVADDLAAGGIVEGELAGDVGRDHDPRLARRVQRAPGRGA